MYLLTIYVAVFALVFSSFWVRGSRATDELFKFDEFGDVNCEEEYARLDNVAVQLNNEPTTKAAIVFFGGRMFRGKLPRRGDAAARAARLKPYLVGRRGIPSERVILIDGGYAEEWHVQIWITPPGFPLYTLKPSDSIKNVRLRKGKPNPREFKCGI